MSYQNFQNASINMNQINKSNVTLWKNRDSVQNPKLKTNQISNPISVNNQKGMKSEDSKQIESEFIDNLKKQIYFMEMELKLMKEREKEIAKSGGFTQLFNDDKDPSIHIQQLKTKYGGMRKKMEDQIEELNDKKREVTGLNVSLKAKLSSLQKLEEEVYNKLKNLDEKSNKKLNEVNAKYLEKSNERNNIEANIRFDTTKLKTTKENNENLQYSITGGNKKNEMNQNDFDNDMKLTEEFTEEKRKALQLTNDKIKEIDDKTTQEPFYKEEMEKNIDYKKQIVELKEKLIELNTEAECAELVNNFLIKKKNDAIVERKKYIDLNIELKHEIEAKNTLNDTRVQKKVRENNSEEIQNLNEHLNETNEKIKELEIKIKKENEKIHNFSLEIIKIKIQLEHKNEANKDILSDIDEKGVELTKIKETNENLESQFNELKKKYDEAKVENALLRNKHKKLSEEDAAVKSKFDFITKNYDYTTNLKKISMEDLKNLASTNTLVNSTIDNFVDKVGTFKKNNIESLFTNEE